MHGKARAYTTLPVFLPSRASNKSKCLASYDGSKAVLWMPFLRSATSRAQLLFSRSESRAGRLAVRAVLVLLLHKIIFHKIIFFCATTNDHPKSLAGLNMRCGGDERWV